MTDYHSFSNKDTPEQKRRELGIGALWLNAAKCLKCGDYIRSKNRHDFVRCSCGNVAVDGGSWYARRAFETDEFTDFIEYFDDVEIEEED